MTNPGSSDLAILAQVSAEFERRCEAIGNDQWDLPTPCSEWNLDQLVDHVTGGNRFTVRILNGESADAALAATRRSFDGSHDPRSAALSSTTAQSKAFAVPGVLDRRCQHLVAEMSGRAVLRLRLHELIIHTWDIAQTLNPPATIPSDLATWALTEIADPDSTTANDFALDTAALQRGDLAPQSALLSAFGRSPASPMPNDP